MERVEIALIELEYAIADFAQYRVDDPNSINSALIAALQEKMRAVEDIFRAVPVEPAPRSGGGAAVS